MGFLKYERTILFSVISFVCILMIMSAGVSKEIAGLSATMIYSSSLLVIIVSAFGLGMDYLMKEW